MENKGRLLGLGGMRMDRGCTRWQWRWMRCKPRCLWWWVRVHPFLRRNTRMDQKIEFFSKFSISFLEEKLRKLVMDFRPCACQNCRFRGIFCFGRCRLRQEIEHRFLTDFFKKSCRNLLDLAVPPLYARVWPIFGIWQTIFERKCEIF